MNNSSLLEVHVALYDHSLTTSSAFGYANLRRKEMVTPYHQFRVGSVSKPITAAAVLVLVDQGLLDIDKRVFGPDSIFGRNDISSQRKT